MKTTYELYKNTVTWASQQNKHSECKEISWDDGLVYCEDHNEFVDMTAKEKFQAGIL